MVERKARTHLHQQKRRSDAEGDEIANGVYFYRVSAQTAGGAHVQQLGRLVKLRPARHIDYNTTP